MAEATARVFVVNLDAEHEMVDPAWRRSTRMRASMLARATTLCESFARTTGVEPVFVIDATDPASDAALAADGDCWCPTPSALGVLRDLGRNPPPAPVIEVLRRVNHRAFAAELGLGLGLADAVFTRDVDTVFRTLAAQPGRRFVLKRALSFAGRMRRVVRGSDLDDAARTWITASIEGYGGGLAVEPFVEVFADFSLHGRIETDGRSWIGRPVALQNADGAFSAARLARDSELSDPERSQLVAATRTAFTALRSAGYFGPVGIDAFRWRDERGTLRFQPLCEINARYTMAWWIGMECPTPLD